MAGGPLPEKIAAPLLLAAACFDMMFLACLTAPLTARIETLFSFNQPELLTLFTFACLLFVYWVGTELLLGGRTLGRWILQLEMQGKNGRPATKMQRTARAIRKITTLGATGLRMSGLAYYDRKTSISWTSPLAPKPRRPIAAWQLMVETGAEKGTSITFGQTRGFQNSKSIKIGRDRAWSDLVLTKGTNVSGKHAALMVRDGALGLIDNGSTNGTFANGQQLKPKKAVNIGNADHFYIADIKIRIIR